MLYKFIEKANFEDLSSGRVIYNKTGFTNFSVRLTCELFMRCIEILGVTDKKVIVYDPCCGGGYLLTVLGFVCNERIDSLYGSDASEEAVILAESNLKLLAPEGLNSRKEELNHMYNMYGKESHYQAVKSAENLRGLIQNQIRCATFKRDILDSTEENTLAKKGCLADIVITDVPYGNLVSWTKDDSFAIDEMTHNLLSDLSENAIIAISTDKRQKINATQYKRIERLRIGKRKVEILKRSD